MPPIMAPTVIPIPIDIISLSSNIIEHKKVHPYIYAYKNRKIYNFFFSLYFIIHCNRILPILIRKI